MTTQTFAEQMQQARDLRAQLTDLESGDEKEMVFQLVLQPFDNLKSVVVESLNQSFNRAEEKILGKDFQELDLQDIDAIIRGDLSTGAVDKMVIKA